MYLDRLFKMMAERQASDLFISCGAPINMKVNGVVAPLSDRPMDLDTIRRVAYELMSEEQAKTFDAEFIALARAVYRTNDDRGRVKRAINTLLGSDIIEEKQYVDYRDTE